MLVNLLLASLAALTSAQYSHSNVFSFQSGPHYVCYGFAFDSLGKRDAFLASIFSKPTTCKSWPQSRSRAEICNTGGDMTCNFTMPLAPFGSAPLATAAHLYGKPGKYVLDHFTISPSANTGGNLTLNYLSPAGCHADLNTMHTTCSKWYDQCESNSSILFYTGGFECYVNGTSTWVGVTSKLWINTGTIFFIQAHHQSSWWGWNTSTHMEHTWHHRHTLIHSCTIVTLHLL